MSELSNAAINFALLVLLFVPLERAFQAKSQPIFRPSWPTDLAFFLGQRLLFATAAVSLLALVFEPLSHWELLLGFRHAFSTQPVPLQVVEAFVMGDLCMYWGHRFQHHNAFLWRFHAVHHSSEHLDWLAAHREHPVDGIYTQFWVNLPLHLAGFDLGTVMGILVFRGAWAIFVHSNSRLPLGPLRYLVGSPALHHWHHSKDRHVGNYANLAPYLDWLFGTYRLPDGEPLAFGADAPMPKGYLRLLLHPFVPLTAVGKKQTQLSQTPQ